ncbi:MAG: hypothetical protein OIN88_09190 [Candidatus Methanoperedens sp.]|nr:hypothetical protein [Candidatus Methanoperedens sp.]MCZ7361534.1 hypothetical protein [Candidatus Methanoperedens sp.]
MAGIRAPVKSKQEDVIALTAGFIMKINCKDYFFVIKKKLE